MNKKKTSGKTKKAATKKRVVVNKKRVNVMEKSALDYWTKALKCTKEKLHEAVQEVGDMAADVKAWLKKHC